MSADRFRIFGQQSRGILTRTSGFIAEAGFTHSLTPARNCTFACTYCYVPTMGLYGGLQPDDWRRWGQFTTFKDNAPQLLRKQLSPSQRIYCSPLVDPYQLAEEQRRLMPEILDALLACPPAVFTMQTRGPLILRDLDQLLLLSRRTRLRVSFSVTTDRDAVRRLYEPHCAPMDERFEVISRLNGAGIDAHATLAPILPCDAGHLLDLAMAASPHAIIADPLHLRERKPMGATTREQSFRIAAHHHHEDWFRAGFQDRILATMKDRAAACGRQFGFGPEAFAWLSQT